MYTSIEVKLQIILNCETVELRDWIALTGRRKQDIAYVGITWNIKFIKKQSWFLDWNSRKVIQDITTRGTRGVNNRGTGRSRRSNDLKAIVEDPKGDFFELDNLEKPP